MSKSFLITSHTEGSYPFEQRSILNGLVKSLKRYFPDCFIVIASQSEVEVDTQQIADYVIVDRQTVNQPYGAGEIALLDAGLRTMTRFGRKDCYKIVYDFLIDDTNYQVFDQWLTHGKDFVGCYWRANGLGIGSWVWYGTVEIQKKIVDFDSLNMNLECKILESVQNKKLLDNCYIYDNHELMFNGNWVNNCDLVHAGGSVLKHKYGTVAAVVELTDDSESRVPRVIQSLAEQSKHANHLVLVDRRTVKEDLRVKEVYQDLFALLGNRNISWNLIYYVNDVQVLTHLVELGHGWCWLVDNKKLLDRDALKNMYRVIILDYNIGTISLGNGSLFYRNKIVNISEINTDIHNFIVDKMTDTCYNNIVL